MLGLTLTWLAKLGDMEIEGVFGGELGAEFLVIVSSDLKFLADDGAIPEPNLPREAEVCVFSVPAPPPS